MTVIPIHGIPMKYEPESFLLYHWSPLDRRKSIIRYGLVPGKLSTDRIWRPPYIAYASSPSLAWTLSAATERGQEYDTWDLWCIWANILKGYEVIPFDDGSIKEYRVYDRVYKRDIWFVGTRTHQGEEQGLTRTKWVNSPGKLDSDN